MNLDFFIIKLKKVLLFFYSLFTLVVNFKTRFTPESIIYKASVSPHKIFMTTPESKQIEFQFAVVCFFGLILLVKLFGNEG